MGNYREISAEKLIAFERFTDRVGDSVIVLVNPSQRVVTERILIPNSKLMNGSHLMDILEPMQKPIETLAGLATVSLPAQSFRVLAIDIAAQGGYTAFKCVQ